MAFDVLVDRGTPLLDLPWSQRRERLEALDLAGPAWATPPVGDDLPTSLQTAAARGLEGVVSKRRDARYRPGERSPDWRKLRLMREQEFVVGGLRRGQGNRRGSFGSLVVGTWDPASPDPARPLRHAGGVGSGFSEREIARLGEVVADLVTDTSPFHDLPARPRGHLGASRRRRAGALPRVDPGGSPAPADLPRPAVDRDPTDGAARGRRSRTVDAPRMQQGGRLVPRSIWTGAISFGLVNIPIRLVTAVEDKSVSFRQIRRGDNSRIRHRRVAQADGEEVAQDDIVKGYEIAPDRYVVIDPNELKALDPKSSRTIDIEDFVELSEIDPIYFDSSYYLVPQETAAKPYRLLHEAMRASGKAAIARFVLRSKQYLAVLRPLGDAIAVSTMVYHDEVVPTSRLDGLPGEEVELNERELAMAEQLVASMTADVGAREVRGHLPPARCSTSSSRRPRARRSSACPTPRRSPATSST